MAHKFFILKPSADSQAGRHGFESRLPLHVFKDLGGLTKVFTPFHTLAPGMAFSSCSSLASFFFPDFSVSGELHQDGHGRARLGFEELRSSSGSLRSPKRL